MSGTLLIVSGPSGVGKTTITAAIRDAFPGCYLSVSCTTRQPSPTDAHAVDYHFVSHERFRAMIDAGELLEHAEVYGQYYGTPRAPVEDALARGQLVILEIDVQGATQVKRAIPDALAIFILPPSEEILLQRLRARKRDDEDAIQRRFAAAKREIDLARASNVYSAFIVNRDLPDAVREAVDLVRGRIGPRARG